MSLVKGFSVQLFVNHSNNMLPEMIITVKSWGLLCLFVIFCEHC